MFCSELSDSARYPLCFTNKDDEYQPIRDLKLSISYISSECLANIDATSLGNTQSGTIRGEASDFPFILVKVAFQGY
jgi:hypothetical protein